MTVQVPVLDEANAKRAKVRAERIAELVSDGFDVKMFAENFEVLVNAAGSAKHLKELVLHLAVSGRLSSGTGETADSLLTDLQRARPRLAKTGVRLGEASVEVTEDEAPHRIPAGWRWVRLGDLGAFLGGGTPAKSNAAFWEGPLPWVSPKDMKRPYIDDAEDHISMAAVEGSAVKLVPAQSILCVVRGMILAHSFPVAIATRQVTINQDMKALVLAIPELAEFVLRSCQAARTRVLAKVERSSHGTCRLDSEVVEMLPIALPPLAEQTRIVAKVGQLMALCDDLEAGQTKKRETGTRLTKSALEALTTADGPGEFEAAWKRVLENFNVLVDREEKIGELKQVVRGLGVIGKLEPQRPADGRGAEIIIEARKDRRRHGIAERTGGDVVGNPLGLAIPPGWCLTSFDELAAPKANAVKAGPFGSALTKSMYVELGFKIYGQEQVIGNNAHLGNYFIDKATFDRLRSCAIAPGDILISLVGTIGRVLVLPDNCSPGIINPRLVKISLTKRIAPAFIKLYLESPIAKRFLQAAAHGGTMDILNLGILRTLPILLPPLGEQKRIVARVEHLIGICDNLERRLQRTEGRATNLIEAVAQELVA